MLGLSVKNCKKQDLVEKLNKARENKAAYLSAEEITGDGAGDREALVNDGFPARSKWVLLQPHGEALTDELIVEGERFRGPSVPQDEFERTGQGGGGQKKFNYPQTFPKNEYENEVMLPRLNKRTNKAVKNADGEYIYEMRKTNRSVPNMEFINFNGLTMESQPHEWVDAFIPRYVFFLVFFLLFIILALTNIVLLSILGGKEKKLSLSLALETGAGSPI